MRFTLTQRSRALLLFLSASGYVAWFSGLGERTDAATFEGTPATAAASPHFGAQPAVSAVIRRDPFAGAPVATPVPDAPAPSAHQIRSEPVRGASDGANGIDVPNIGDAPEAPQPVQLIVRATIVGAHPVAYVENGSEMDIVRVGDTLGSERVVAIDLGGLAFDDGSRLDLAGATALAPTPRPAGPSIAQQLAALRQLLLRRMAAPATSTPAGAAPPPLAQASEVTTPAPLPTADSRGLAPGVNPTPDLSGPTAFPYPYPYPPRAH